MFVDISIDNSQCARKSGGGGILSSPTNGGIFLCCYVTFSLIQQGQFVDSFGIDPALNCWPISLLQHLDDLLAQGNLVYKNLNGGKFCDIYVVLASSVELWMGETIMSLAVAYSYANKFVVYSLLSPNDPYLRQFQRGQKNLWGLNFF
jgi:hypothetical protein